MPTATCVPGIGDCSATVGGKEVVGGSGTVVDEETLKDEVVAVVEVVVEVVVDVDGVAVQAPFRPSEAITDAAWGGVSPRRSGTKTVLGNVREPFAIVIDTDDPLRI